MTTYPLPLINEIAARRVALGLSQEAVAARIGVRGVTVSWWETGRCSPPLPRLLAYADAVGLQVLVASKPADVSRSVSRAATSTDSAFPCRDLHVSRTPGSRMACGSVLTAEPAHVQEVTS